MNTDFDENRKEFWAFVGRKSKGKKKNIASLKSDTGLSLTSIRGKLEVLQRHYQLLSKMSVDSVFDADWKEEVRDNVKGYSSLSEEVTDSLLDKEIEKGEISKCLRNLKNSKICGSDGIVGELHKYGGFGMVDLLEQLFSVIWQEEIVPRQWREGLILYYNMQCFFVCLVSMESHTVQLTHMNFILSEPGWAWAGCSHSPIIHYDG